MLELGQHVPIVPVVTKAVGAPVITLAIMHLRLVPGACPPTFTVPWQPLCLQPAFWQAIRESEAAFMLINLMLDGAGHNDNPGSGKVQTR